jgi:hypothetical protein
MDQHENQQVSGWPARSRRIPWLPLLFAILTIITFYAVSGGMQGNQIMYGFGGGGVTRSDAVPPTSAAYPQAMENSAGSVSAPAMPPSSGAIATQGVAVGSDYYPHYPVPAPYYGGQATASDTREFLKTNYNASMRTRDVQGLTRRVETTVRGYGGRVDQTSSSPQYGSVTFVVPADKFDDFRTELEGMVNWRFLTVNVSSENLLPQKQSIEQQQTQTQSSLADLKTSRAKLVASHTSTVNSLQSQIDADTQQIASLSAQTLTTPAIQAQIQTLLNDQASLKSRLANENASYAANLQKTDSNIKYTQQNLDALGTQNQNLLDNVATVDGTVSISWISLWEMALAYLPGYWIPSIFAALTVLSYLWDRRRNGPSILGF